MRQEGSLKLLFPRTSSRDLQGVLINTAGGITGGDRFEVNARAEIGTKLTLTTQAAERAYRVLDGQVGHVTTTVDITKDASLNWMPQETILYDGCALDRKIRINMASGARLLFVEPVIFGRSAMGEEVTDGYFADRVELRRSDDLVYLDTTRFHGDISEQLRRPSIANGAAAMVSVIYVSPNAAALLPRIRAMLPVTAGASLLHDDVLVLRGLANDSLALRGFLLPILKCLSGAELPRPWMI